MGTGRPPTPPPGTGTGQGAGTNPAPTQKPAQKPTYKPPVPSDRRTILQRIQAYRRLPPGTSAGVLAWQPKPSTVRPPAPATGGRAGTREGTSQGAGTSPAPTQRPTPGAPTAGAGTSQGAGTSPAPTQKPTTGAPTAGSTLNDQYEGLNATTPADYATSAAAFARLKQSNPDLYGGMGGHSYEIYLRRQEELQGRLVAQQGEMGYLESQLPADQQGQAFGLQRQSQTPGILYNQTLRGRLEEWMGNPVVTNGMAMLDNAMLAGLGTGLVSGQAGAVTGLVAGAWGLATGQRLYDENGVVGKALEAVGLPADWATKVSSTIGWALNVGAETTEQVLGTGAQLAGSVIDPDTYGKIQDVKDLQAAWEAARLTYETTPVSTKIGVFENIESNKLSDPEEAVLGVAKFLTPGLAAGYRTVRALDFQDERSMFVDFDLPTVQGGLLAQVAVRKFMANPSEETALAFAREYMDEANAQAFAAVLLAPEVSDEERRTMMASVFGAPGQVRDLAFQFADPLNFVGAGQVEALRGVTALARRLGKPMATLEKVAQLAKVGKVADGVLDLAQAYRNLKVTGLMREGLQTAQKLNRLQKVLVGEDIMRVLDGTYKPPKAWEVWRLTPKTMAVEQTTQFSNHVQAYVTNAVAVDDNFLRNADAKLKGMRSASLDKGVDNLDPAARSMLTLEGSIHQQMLNYGGDVSGDLAKAWDATEGERKTLLDMAQKLKDTPEGIMARLARGQADDLLRLYGEAGGQVMGLTGKGIAEAFKSFSLDRTPYTPEMARAALTSGLMDQASKWAVETFQLKPPGFLEKIAGIMKGAQSAILMGFNPGYLMNNVINNEATMVAKGAWGLESLQSIVDEFARRGLTPARLMDGSSIADGEAFLAATRAAATKSILPWEGNFAPWGEKAAAAGQRAIGEATKADGVLGAVQQAANKFAGATPIMKMSAPLEKWAGARAYHAGFKQWWSGAWQRGLGFDKMSAELEGALAQIDPRLVDQVYGAIEAGVTPAEISAAALQKATTPTVGTFYGELVKRAQAAAAEGATITEDELRQVLAIGGLDEQLNAALKKHGYSESGVRAALGETRVTAELHLAEWRASTATATMEYLGEMAGGNEAGLTDAGAILNELAQQRLAQTDTFIAHKRILEDLWTEKQLRGEGFDIDNWAKRLHESGDRLWQQGYFKEVEARMAGLQTGMAKAKMPLDKMFMDAVQTEARLAKEFFTTKQQLYKDFFSLPAAQRSAAVWEDVQRRVDEGYTRLIALTQDAAATRDGYIVAAYEKRFPGSGEKVAAWLDLARTNEAAYQEAVIKQFKDMQAVGDPHAKSARWTEFNNRMIQQRKVWVTEEALKRRAVWADVPGNAAIEAGMRAAGVGTGGGPGPTPTANPVATVGGVQVATERAGVAEAPTPPPTPTPEQIRTRVVRQPRSDLPQPLSQAIEGLAQQMMSDLQTGEPGSRVFIDYAADQQVLADPSTYPDWYKRLSERFGVKKETVQNALKKVIADAGTDVDRAGQSIVARVKGEIFRLLTEGDPLNGMPPEPDVLSWMGRSEEEVQAAYQQWFDAGSMPTIKPITEGGLRAVEMDEAPMLTPPGIASDGGGQMPPVATAAAATYYNQVRPTLGNLEQIMLEDVGRPRLKGLRDLPPAVADGLGGYLKKVGGQMSEATLGALKWGEYKRDSALLNYSRRHQFDTYLGAVAPYQFWATHSMIRWAAESIQRPALFAWYYRMDKFLKTQVQKPGFPARLAGRIRIPMPFLPEWMQGGLWVDPLKMVLPFENFGGPWEQQAQAQSSIEFKGERKLQEMLDAGQITQAQYTEAMSHTGDVWNQAAQQVVAEDKSLRFDGMDFAQLLFPPAMPVQWAYQAMRGTPERIAPLGLTRDIRALSAAVGVGGPGGINIEEGVRRAMNLPVLDQWADYRIDRELANMAGEGVITAEQARVAMIERSGPVFDQALRREVQAGGGNLPQWVFGKFVGGAGVLPEGEERLRILSKLNAAAWEAEKNGNPEPLANFLALYPEYEARLALKQDPESRLQNFLIDQVWAGYSGLPELYRRQFNQAAGATFQEAFLNKETRSYDSISPDMLASWAKALGRYVPRTITGPALDIDYAPPEVARDAQGYYTERKARFGEAVFALQSQYFSIPEDERTPLPAPGWVTAYYTARDEQFPGIGETVGTYDTLTGEARKQFRKAHPELNAYYDWRNAQKQGQADFGRYIGKGDAYRGSQSARSAFIQKYPQLGEYWDWRKAYLERYPWIEPYVSAGGGGGATSSATPQDTKADEQKRQAAFDPIIATPEMQRLALAYAYAGEQLPAEARSDLQAAWQAQGGEGTFAGWLREVLAYGGNLGQPAGPEFQPPTK